MDLKSKNKKAHPSTPNFKCSFCKYKTHLQTTLYNHIRTHTKERPYKCPEQYCNAAFAQKISLDVHQFIHKKDDETLYKFKCSKCPYKTVFNSSFKRHLKTHSDFKEFSCDLCSFRARQKEHIKMHNYSVHLKLKPFKCPQPNCNYVCSQNWILNKHQVVHQGANEKASLLKFQCTECPYKTYFKGSLVQHLMVHSKVKQFGCDLCPFRTKSKNNLSSHNKQVHSTLRPFKCPQPDCNYSAKRSSELSRHKKVHIFDKPLRCSQGCSFTTKWKDCLKNHEMMHRGEKPFKCSLCPMAFTQMGHLSSHFRQHTGETPYSCPSCPFRAKSSTNLKSHLKICTVKTNGEFVLKKGQIFPQNTAFKCKVAGCGFLTEHNSSVAIHYNNIHKLPRVKITETKI